MFSRCVPSADPQAIATGAIRSRAYARSPKRTRVLAGPNSEDPRPIKGMLMSKLLLDNLSLIAGETIKLLILIVTGVVLLDRVKNSTSQLNKRIAALEDWRDEHISSVEPHTVCILENRRKIDERDWLERIERKIDRLEERIDALTQKLHG